MALFSSRCCFMNFFFQTAMVFSTGLFSFFILSFELTSLAGKPLYLIWVCCLFLSFSGNFSLLPTATAKAFGKTHYGVNYGMVFTSSVSYTFFYQQFHLREQLDITSLKHSTPLRWPPLLCKLHFIYVYLNYDVLYC